LNFIKLRNMQNNLYKICRVLMANIIFLSFAAKTFSQTTETLSAGSFIINMGIVPQTDNNALKPYGLLYQVLKGYNGPIKWIIEPTKAKDGVDFVHNGVSYRGGTFIIPAEARTAGVNALITSWQGQGVVGTTTTTPLTLPVYATLKFVPKWVLDDQNGQIAVDFFNNAGIPSTAYGGTSSSGWVAPANLDCCVDLFVMPHAEPEWVTHSRLYSWNLDCKGAIWFGCKAGSELTGMFNSSNPSMQTNFLAEKNAVATGTSGKSDNALIFADDHTDGTPPYSYDYPTDPIMQFMGIIDRATQQGAEQVYIPKSAGWRPTTKVGVYDPDHSQKYSNNIQHRAAMIAWGRGFGDSNRGQVMMEASHDIAKASSPDNIAAQRAFFNFSFIALADKRVIPSIVGLPNVKTDVTAGTPIPMSVSVPPPALISDYTISWSSSCGGTFSPSASAASVTFTPPTTYGNCQLSLKISDACGRETFDAKYINVIPCTLSVTPTLGQLCVGATNTGSINMVITGGTAPYSYTWTRTGGGSGTGTGTTISGLAAGTYSVSVNSTNGCSKSFSTTLNSFPAINISTTPISVACNGGNTGAINLTISSGTAPYTYNWGGGITSQNRSNLTAGTYSVIVTDSKNCTATSSATITAPTAITATTTVTNLDCFGVASGVITLSVSGGVSPYTYLWNDGTATQNRSNLAAGTYSVVIKDANNCTQTVSGISITQPSTGVTITNTTSPATCGGSNGSITATVTGGTAPYTYDWSGTPTGDGTPTITGLSAGIYDVKVTDSKGCQAIKSITLTPQSVIILGSAIINPTCPPGTAAPLSNDGSITLIVSGGTAPFSYSWTTSNGSGLVANNKDQTNLTAGTYSVVVTDASGCTATKTFTLVYSNNLPVKPGTITNN
jgi:hypothetical protein